MKQFLIAICSFLVFVAQAQNDSLSSNMHINDSLPSVTDSLKSDTAKNNLQIDSIAITKTSYYGILEKFDLVDNTNPQYLIVRCKEPIDKDILFYILLTVLLYFGVVRLFFSKYIGNLFSIIFQTQFRQAQTREQLHQENGGSLLLNILFFISTGIFIALVTQALQVQYFEFYKSILIFIAALIVIYLFKLLFIKFLGAIFNKPNAAKTYTFIVFVVNKIWGILLLPILFFIAFSTTYVSMLFLKIAIILVLVLLIIRIIITYKSLSNILKINAIHFFLYFCSLEILPLLIIFKFLNKNVSSGI